MIYAFGDIYEGYYSANLYHGLGRLISYNGRTYTGQFLHGKQTGHAKLTYENGDIY